MSHVDPHARRIARAGATAWQLVGVGAAVLLSGWAIGRLMPVLLPLAVAVLLTALVRPAAVALERRGLPPGAAALVTLLIVVVALAGVVALIVPPFVGRVAALSSSVQDGAQQVAYSLGRHVGMSHADVDRAVAHVATGVRKHLGGVAGDAMTGATAAVTACASAVLVAFLSFFLIRDGTRLWGWAVGLAPPERRLGLRVVGSRAWSVLTVYARGVVFVATVDAIFIGLALVLVGVPLALPLIVLTWLGAFFPIVGAVSAGAVAVLVTLVADGPGSAVVILAAIVVVQQIEGNVLYPQIVGPRLRLHPIAVLLAVAIGATVAGVAGAFLAVPVATVAATALEYSREDR